METSESSPEARPADVSAGTSKAPPEAQDDSNYSPTALRTRQRVGPGQVIQAPLRQAVGPGGESLLVHVPFTTLDLLNWKHSVGPYRENLTEMHQLLETVMISHNPNWADLQALLNTLLTVEEKRMVVEKAQAETRNLAKNALPVWIELKPGAVPVRVPQHPISLTARKGLEPLINDFLSYGLIRECQSSFNTPILPVKKKKKE
uniref:Core shell protein Gag P30 domain-containing protein n=1 Tax=Anser brachyrhynchus TaxID=132585 RepID=A0A8B9CZY4_9AVES